MTDYYFPSFLALGALGHGGWNTDKRATALEQAEALISKVLAFAQLKEYPRFPQGTSINPDVCIVTSWGAQPAHLTIGCYTRNYRRFVLRAQVMTLTGRTRIARNVTPTHLRALARYWTSGAELRLLNRGTGFLRVTVDPFSDDPSAGLWIYGTPEYVASQRRLRDTNEFRVVALPWNQTQIRALAQKLVDLMIEQAQKR